MPSHWAHLGLNFWDGHLGFCFPTTPSLLQGYDLCSKFRIFLGLLTILSLWLPLWNSPQTKKGTHCAADQGMDIQCPSSSSAFPFCCFRTSYIICITTAPHFPFLTSPRFLQLLSKIMGTFSLNYQCYIHMYFMYMQHTLLTYTCGQDWPLWTRQPI